MHSESDVIVIGAGFAGLMAADRLSRMGYSVLIVDHAPKALAGASSRNEGWLHAGTYHSVSVRDEAEAIAVARRCRYGWAEIQRRFPECVELESSRSVAIVPEHDHPTTEHRWRSAGVGFSELPARAVRELRSEVHLSSEELAFEVDDVGINTRILASSLTAELVSRSVRFMLEARVRGRTGQALDVVGRNGVEQVRYRYIVCAAGYGLGSACADLDLPPVELRYWRSHLVSLPRLSRRSVFSTAAGEAAMINHGAWSIVGLNEDATIVAEPCFEVDDGVAERLIERVEYRFRTADRAATRKTACIKVDYAQEVSAARSVNVRTIPLAPDVLALLPGKMTESPFSANAVAAAVFEALGNASITERPIDAEDVQGRKDLAHV